MNLVATNLKKNLKKLCEERQIYSTGTKSAAFFGMLTDSCCGWDLAGPAKVPCFCALREHVALEGAVLWEVRQLGFGPGH